MAPVLPPADERFDPITGIWSSPDGPPADPERTGIDPRGEEPVTLLGPVPPELAQSVESAGSRFTPSQRLHRVILALVLIGVVALVVASLVANRPSEPSAILLDPEHVLLAHCGIDELRYQGHWYERVGGVLDDGDGNPPAGWDNPAQLGRLSAIDSEQPPTRVVFTDDHGHHEEFTLRPGATDPKRRCA
ncbi:MAG: hypothetical protein KIT69_05570 [Propionibacteriaceae bacterium]|nr:hypothetical protein [Propionibacteriaceae bacterium]